MNMYTITPKDPWLAQTNKFDVHEKIKTAFLKFNIAATLGTMPVRGNVGVQFVDSDQNSNGFAWNDSGSGGPDGGAVLPVSGGATYSDVLPSLNLVVDLQQDLILRFGLGKTMARPRMDDMRAGADQPALTPITQSPDETIGTWSASGGGKPDLKPWRAKSVDLSLEKYFQKRSYVAVAGFLKKLDSFIYQRTSERDAQYRNAASGAPKCPSDPRRHHDHSIVDTFCSTRNERLQHLPRWQLHATKRPTNPFDAKLVSRCHAHGWSNVFVCDDSR